jgi:hypothetical protein
VDYRGGKRLRFILNAIFIMLLFLSIVSFVVYRNAPAKYYLKHTGVECLYNHSVGNEWVHEVFVNGQLLDDSGIRVYPNLTRSLILAVRSTELDNIPDRGSTWETVYTTSLLRGPVYLTVRVRENRGRYAGNWAEWRHRISLSVVREGLLRTKVLFALLVISLVAPFVLWRVKPIGASGGVKG